MIAVLFVQVDAEVEPILRHAAESLPGGRVEAVDGREDAVSRLEHGRAVDAVVLGSGVEAPLEMARRIGAAVRDTAVLILTKPEAHGQMVRALQVAPPPGVHVQCRPVTEGESLAAALVTAARATRRRRRPRTAASSGNTRPALATHPRPDASAAYLRQLLDHAPVGIVVTDAHGRVVTWNHAAAALFGRSERDMLGSPLHDLFPDTPAEQFSDLFAGPSAAKGSSTTGILMRGNAEGETRYLEATVTPLGPESGRPGNLLLFQDVTQRLQHLHERRRAEEAARLLAAMVESSNDAIISKDLDAVITSWNTGAQRLYGYTAEEVIGQPISILAPPERADEIPGIMERLKHGERIEHYETERVRKDGTRLHVSVTISPIRDPAGRFVGASTITRDISERKAAERCRAAEYAVSRTLSRATGLDEAVEPLVRAIGDALGWDMGTLWLADPQRQVLRRRSTWRAASIPIKDLKAATRPAERAPGRGLTGRVWRDGEPVWIPDLRQDRTFARRRAVVESGLRTALAFPLRGPGGVHGVMEYFARDVRPPDDELLRTVGIIGNQVGQFIERVRAEQELQRREEEFRALARNIPDIVARFDRELRHLYLNPVIEAVTGLPVQAFLGKTSREAGMPAALCDTWESHLRRVFETGQEGTVEFAFPSPGGVRHFQSRIVPEFDTAGTVSTVLSLTRDITELKRAEDGQRFLAEAGAALVGSLEHDEVLATLARLAVPRIADGSLMYLVGEDGTIRRAAMVFHDPEKERAAAAVFKQVPVTDDDAHPIARVIRSGRPLLVERTTEEWGNASFRNQALRGLAGTLRVRSLIIAPLTARGRTLGAISFVHAESGRRYGPADLALIEDLARRAALALDNARLYQEAQAAVRLREEFLSIASHELKTPLTTVKGYVQLLSRQFGQPDVNLDRIASFTEQLQAQVARLEGLVADLLDASRLQQGRLALRPEPMDLAQLAAQVLARFAHAPERTPAHTLTLEAPAPVRGAWDPGRLDQVLSNLLSNALKYSPAGGAVRVAVRAAGGRAELAVADQGLGIPPAEQAALFRPFVRGATARRAVGGEGLGLYIAREIVRRHGGRIALASTPGRGTTVTVTLPLQPPDAAEEDADPGPLSP